MNETCKNLVARRSMRKFKEEQLLEHELQDILRAGMNAPSGMNRQSAIMVVVQNPEVREKLRAMNAAIIGNPDMDPFYGAPTIVIVLADRNAMTWKEDGCLVMGNLMNAAHSMGIGSCWIHRAFQEFESPEGKELLAQWGLSGDYAGIGHCALGYPDGEEKVIIPKDDYVVRI